MSLDEAWLRQFPLPAGWSWSTVEELGAPNEQPVLTGPFGSSLKGAFRSHGVPVLTIGSLTSHGIDAGKSMFVATDTARELERYRLRTGDFLFSRMASVGRAGIVPAELDGALFNYHVMRLRLDESRVDPRLFLSWVRGSPVVSEYLKEVNHGATRDGINTEQLLAMPVALPSLDLQRRIVAKLDELLAKTRAAREQLEAVPALVEQYRQSVLAAAFRGDLTADWRKKNPDVEPASKLLERIRIERRQKWEAAELAKLKAKGKSPKDDKWKSKYVEPEPIDTSELPELPPTWCWVSFDELCCESLYGPRFGEHDYAQEGVPTIRTTDMHPHGFIEMAEPPRVKVTAEQLAGVGLKHHDLLVTRTGSIGRCALYDAALGPALPSAYLIRFRLVLPLVSATYALRFMLSPRAQNAMGLGATAVTQPNINARTLGRIAVPLGPLREQEELLQRSSACLKAVSRLETSVSRRDIQEMERAVLAKAFRGELVT